MKLLTGATLIDGTGKPSVENAAVLIDGDRIVEVGPSAAVDYPNTAEVVDIAGMTLIPGDRKSTV